MAKLIDWQECENELEWQMAQKQAAGNSVRHVPTQKCTVQGLFRWGISSLFVVLVFALLGAWWLWDTAQRGFAEIETEIEAAVIAEQWKH